MERRWTLPALAQACGRSPRTVRYLASAGLLPGYYSDMRSASHVPWDVGLAFAQVMRTGAYSREFAAVMRDDPEQALATAEAMATVARAALEMRREREMEAA